MRRRIPSRTVLILGGTGKTGRPLAEQLVARGISVRLIVRSPHKLPPELSSSPSVAVANATLLDLPDAELQKHVAGCDAVVSCLGHVVSCSGMFGQPRRLVTEVRSKARLPRAPGLSRTASYL